MKHPNPTKLREVAAKFREIYVNEKETKLDFGEAFVNQYGCKTVACHGGWACEVLKEGTPYDDGEGFYADGVQLLGDYVIGRTDMPRDFFRMDKWADENPNLWGNIEGIEMFSDIGYMAFDSTKEDCTLLTIADWYDAVATRIEELTC